MNLDQLGQKIRTQREKLGLKQNDLAAALQVSPQAVSKWERGENAPDIAALVPLCRVLGVSVEWLLGAYEPDRDVFVATVLVTGLQTTREMSETLGPREFADWTNGVCFLLTEAVVRYDGVPANYIGPGIVAFFSGDGHAQRALQAAISAKRTCHERLKIGLSTGPIYFGPVGHPDYARPDVIGEVFVIAFLSRDWAASHTQSGIVADHRTADSLSDRSNLGEPQPVSFPGIRHEIRLCEVRC
ncbi:MAG: helix-turn-helix domain-containing protein [Verrucomicrobia bacterium]|nr:helix-turn-helix domain-containing protein [Verrucomicrobiota bacterium]